MKIFYTFSVGFILLALSAIHGVGGEREWIGEWINTDAQTRGVPRMVISKTDTTYIEAWGNCFPVECEWGKVPFQIVGESVEDASRNYGFAVWEFVHASKYMMMRFENDLLVVEHITIFKDDSGRSNYRSVSTFENNDPKSTITDIELRPRRFGGVDQKRFLEVHVSFQAIETGWHDLLRSTDLINWKRVSSEPVRSVGQLNTIVDWEGTQSGALAFYRVQQGCTPKVPVPAKDAYFPKPLFSEFKAVNWYGDIFQRLELPSMYLMSQKDPGNMVRFTYIPTWGHSTSVTYELSDGTVQRTYKELDGSGGFEKGCLAIEESSEIPLDTWDSLRGELSDADFWIMDSVEEIALLDGAQFIIEGLSLGKYHIVDRTSVDFNTSQRNLKAFQTLFKSFGTGFN